MVNDNLVKYQTLPVWDKKTIPDVFQSKHNTKPGTWAKLTVLTGELRYLELNPDGEVTDSHTLNSQETTLLIRPQVWHKVAPLSDDMKCFLEFYCRQEDYLQKKYKLSKVHPEVIEVLKYIQSGKVLDLGCGRGRNSLFLSSKGFEVKALDLSNSGISKLEEIMSAEKTLYPNIQTNIYDMNRGEIRDEFDLILATVVLQFLEASAIPRVIDNIQLCTLINGINVIVAPIHSSEHPCPIDFSFTLKEGELKDYYSGWTILKYNEDIGTFHKTDPEGKPYQAKFATLIARKESA